MQCASLFILHGLRSVTGGFQCGHLQLGRIVSDNVFSPLL